MEDSCIKYLEIEIVLAKDFKKIMEVENLYRWYQLEDLFSI